MIAGGSIHAECRRVDSDGGAQRTKGANKGAAGNAVGRLAAFGAKRFGDRTVTPHANRFPGMRRASATDAIFKVLLRSAPPRARA